MDEENSEMSFIEKKEKVANLIEEYILDSDKEKDLLDYIDSIKSEDDFKDKELFVSIFNELIKYLPELSNKELKQRALMIKSFVD